MKEEVSDAFYFYVKDERGGQQVSDAFYFFNSWTVWWNSLWAVDITLLMGHTRVHVKRQLLPKYLTLIDYTLWRFVMNFLYQEKMRSLRQWERSRVILSSPNLLETDPILLAYFATLIGKWHVTCRGQRGSVGITTRCGLGTPRFEPWWGDIFWTPSRLTLRPAQPPDGKLVGSWFWPPTPF